jgi:Rho GTPase-activating protein 1
LEQLKANIELAPQFIPQRVIDHDRQLPTIQQHIDQQNLQRQKRPLPSLAFGRTLEDLASIEGNTTHEFIPKFVIQIVDHIKEHGKMKIA